MKNIVKNIFILILALVISYFLSPFYGKVYEVFFPSITGSFVDFSSLIGLPLACIFFLTLLFTAFGDSKKHWWITVSLIPAILFEGAFDSRHFYFPVAIGLVGWLLGRGVNILVEKLSNKPR